MNLIDSLELVIDLAEQNALDPDSPDLDDHLVLVGIRQDKALNKAYKLKEFLEEYWEWDANHGVVHDVHYDEASILARLKEILQ